MRKGRGKIEVRREKGMIRNLLGYVIILGLICSCGNNAITSNMRLDKNAIREIKPINSVFIYDFICADSLLAMAIKNTIIQELIGRKVSIIADSNSADVIVNGTVTMSSDKISGGGGVVSRYGASAYEASSEGAYVTGVTAQLRKGKNIIWCATETQMRTHSWLPDPGEVMGRKIGKRLAKLLK
jgi:hypothetical protein